MEPLVQTIVAVLLVAGGALLLGIVVRRARKRPKQSSDSTVDLSLERSPMEGVKIGPCRIIRELKGGGQGVVFEAYHTRLQCNVALKLLPEHLRGDRKVVERCLREARIIARIPRKDHIVVVHDVDEDRKYGAYIVMELLSSKTLLDLLFPGPEGRKSRPEPQSKDNAVKIVAQVLSGLESVHAEGICHRDLKLDNVIVLDDGTVKIIDFGFALAPGMTGTTEEILVVGAPGWIAPEVLRGATADERTDIYGVGLILHALVTTFMHPSSSRLEGPLGDVIERMTAEDPGSRYQTAREAKLALEEPPPGDFWKEHGDRLSDVLDNPDDPLTRAFRKEWDKILIPLRKSLEKQGLECTQHGSPVDLIQAWHERWPGGYKRIHLELGHHPPSGVEFRLHAEEETPNARKVQEGLHNVLWPYRSYIRGALDKYDPMVGNNSPHEPLWGRIRYRKVSAEAISDCIRELRRTEPFVDQSLFLVDKKTVWHTGFFSEDPKPGVRGVDRHNAGKPGGWKFSQDGGQWDSPCLKCFGEDDLDDPYNSGSKDRRSLLSLRGGEKFHEFANGETVYLSATVHSARGGRLTFYGEAASGGQFQCAFNKTVEIHPVDAWQHISVQATISNNTGFDFGKDGLFVFVIVDQPRNGLRIDSLRVAKYQGAPEAPGDMDDNDEKATISGSVCEQAPATRRSGPGRSNLVFPQGVDPLAEGWKLSELNRDKVSFATFHDGEFGSALSIRPEGEYALDYDFAPFHRLPRRVRLIVRPLKSYYCFILRLRCASADGSSSLDWGWLSLRIDEAHAKFIGDELKDYFEWSVPVRSILSAGGWQVLDVSIPEAFAATFGTQGFTPVTLLGVRLRGSMDVARIEVDPPRLRDVFPGSFWWSWSEPGKLDAEPDGSAFEIGHFSEDDTYVQEYASYDPKRTDFEHRPALGPVLVTDTRADWEMLRESDSWRWRMQWTLSPNGREFSGTCSERIGNRRISGRRLEPGEAKRIIQHHRES